jgi:hypothetical protein
MQSTPGCLTRVVVGDECDIEMAQRALALQRIQSELRDVPVAQREYIANALLGLAVSRVPYS